MSEERKLQEKEELLRQKLEKIHAMEQEIQEKEKNLRLREKSKKQIILRLSPTLWEEIARWADEDFRSINGQIEFLLTECVRQRKKAVIPNDCSKQAEAKGREARSPESFPFLSERSLKMGRQAPGDT